MAASHHKDYVLTMLFVKYISDKYVGNPNSLIEVPERATFEHMETLKEKSDIGDWVKKEVLCPLFAAIRLEEAMELVGFNL